MHCNLQALRVMTCMTEVQRFWTNVVWCKRRGKQTKTISPCGKHISITNSIEGKIRTINSMISFVKLSISEAKLFFL